MKEKTDWPKYPVLFSLYFAQAVPMSFFSTVVPVIMRQENYSLESIGLLQLIKLPWVLKFLWAPLVDNTAKSLRQYKHWIYGSEIFYAAVIFSIGLFSLQTNVSLIVILMLIAVFASATQDIATDAFAILILKRKERGYGNSMQSAGGFAGNLVGSGVLLIVYYYLGWVYLMMGLAVFVLLALVPLRLYKSKPAFEPVKDKKVTIADIVGFVKLPGMSGWLLVLFLYFSGLMGIMTMLKPFMVDLGYSAKSIGFMAGIAGTSAALVASLVGGFVVKRIGFVRSMQIFVGVSVFAGMFFWRLSLTPEPSVGGVHMGITLLWVAYGLSMVALYTAAMDKVRPGREGTDFTIQIVITHLSGLIIAVMSGKFADVFGYAFLFFIQMLLSAATLTLLIMFKRKLFNAEQGNNI
jgi:MFS family permease